MRVTVTGHKDSLNNGTMLVFLGLVAGLKEHDPETNVSLLSDSPIKDRKLYGSIPNLEIISRPWGVEGRSRISSIGIALIYLLWTAAGRAVEILSLDVLAWPWGNLACHLRRADVVVDVSGDDLTTAYGLFSPLQVLYELIIARMHGCRTALLAHSVGPFETMAMRALAVTVCRTADLVTLRESRSHSWWKRACPKKTLDTDNEDKPLADLMYLVPMPSAGKDTDRGPVVVNVSRYVVETAQPRGKIKSPDLSSHLGEWVGLLRHISQITGRRIVLLPHTCRPGINDDRYFLKRIMELCPSGLPVDLVEDEVTTYDVQKIVAGSSFVLSSRLHLALTSMNCQVPFLALAYSHKYDQLDYQIQGDQLPTVYVKDIPPDQLFDVIKKRFELLWEKRLHSLPEITAHAEKSRELAGINIRLLLNTAGVE